MAQCDPPLPPPPPPDDGGVLLYSLNGQTVQADPSGSFLISNVAAPDLAPADFMGDDYLFLTAVKITSQQTTYAFGQIPFQITPGGTFFFETGKQAFSTFTTTPPVLPESIALTTVGSPIITPASLGGAPVPLQTMATLSDGSQAPATLPCQWTTYRTSNESIARVIPDHPCPCEGGGFCCDGSCRPTGMLVEGISPGVAFITATNGGATSVVKIVVANPGDQIFTTVEGFVRRTDATPVDGAAVTVMLEGGTQLTSGASSADGSFSVGPVLLAAPPGDPPPKVFVNATISNQAGTSPLLTPVPDGITDAGIITIETVCDTPWSTAFGPTTFDLVNGGPFEGPLRINAFAVFDDGAGAALYVAGLFNRAGGVPANDIARWNGRNWEPVGGGITPGSNGSLGAINDMTVADLGDGPALYVVGSFVLADGQGANKVAKWNGVQWSPVGLGVGDSHSIAHAVSAFNDGNGVALYVGGDFHGAGGVEDDAEPIACLPSAPQCVAVPGVAKWNGAEWSAVGSGIDTGPVNALAVFDDGAGAELYAGGDFLSSSQVPSPNIVRWDGLVWSAVGGGLTGNNSDKVISLTVFDDGSGAGTALYAAGNFFGEFGGPSANSVARWNGTNWSGLGNGINGEVSSIVGLDNGIDPPALFVSGPFSNLAGGGPNTHFIARWDGTSWSGVGTGFESVGTALAVLDDGTGSAVYVGGDRCLDCPGLTSAQSGSGTDRRKGYGTVGRSSVGDGTASSAFTRLGYVVKWINSTWSSLSNGLNDEVRALLVFDDDGSGANPPALYAGGRFTPPLGPRDDNAPPFPTSAIAEFDGVRWSSLGVGMDCTGFGCVASVHALSVFDEDLADPDPPRLFVGGDFAFAGGVFANYVARWDGSNWSAVGTVGGIVEALAVFNDGTGSALYAGGMFTGGIKRWDGASAWTTVGGGATGSVFATAVFNGELYIGGSFSDAGGVPGTGFIARWDGTSWSPVQSAGIGLDGAVYALTVFDEGTGLALYAGGEFLTAGGTASPITVNRVAKWDGVAWSALSNGLGPASVSAIRVETLFGFDDGSGPFLYAGGDFTTAPVPGGGTTLLNRLAKWNPILDEWSAVGVSSQPGSDPGGGVDGTGTVAVQALAVFDDGFNGPALFAGGAFETAAGVPSSNIAKLGCR